MASGMGEADIFGPRSRALSEGKMRRSDASRLEVPKPAKTERRPSKEKLEIIWREQHRWPRLLALVDSSRFESLMGALILFNCATVGLNTDGEWTWGDDPPPTPVWLHVSEHLLTFMFTVEIILRMFVFGWKWVLEPMNMLDFVLVFGTGVLVVWILEPLLGSSTVARSLTMLRALRLSRLARVVRRMPQFREMWMLVKGLVESSRTLIWTGIVILSVLYVFAVFGVELLGKSFAEDPNAPKNAQVYFSSVGMSMLTLFQFMTFDSSMAVMRICLAAHNSTLVVSIFFTVFTGVGALVLMNLVTAVIVEQALAVAREDEASRILDRQQEAKKNLEILTNLFLDLDEDGNGELTRRELKDALKLDHIRSRLQLLGFEPTEAMELLEFLDEDCSGTVALEEFVDGLNRMKGAASAKELYLVFKKICSVQRAQVQHNRLVEERFAALQDGLSGVQEALLRLAAPSDCFVSSTRGSTGEAGGLLPLDPSKAGVAKNRHAERAAEENEAKLNQENGGAAAGSHTWRTREDCEPDLPCPSPALPRKPSKNRASPSAAARPSPPELAAWSAAQSNGDTTKMVEVLMGG